MYRLKKTGLFGISVYNFTLVTLGTFLMVLGINLFLAPANLLPTGFTGISYELSFIVEKLLGVHIQYNIIYFLLNVPILIFGFVKIGNKFLVKTVMSVVMFTGFAQIIPQVSTFNIDITNSGDLLISGVIAAIIMGTGCGLILKSGGSSGGSDIIAVYVSLFKGKSFGLYSLIINFFVILVAFFITLDVRLVAITLIHLYVLNSMIDLIHNSQEKRTLIIFTSHADNVKAAIYANFFRSITVIDSEGGYSKEKNSTLIISISYGELHQILKVIKDADEKAFINVFKTDSIIGNFENPYKKTL